MEPKDVIFPADDSWQVQTSRNGIRPYIILASSEWSPAFAPDFVHGNKSQIDTLCELPEQRRFAGRFACRTPGEPE